MPRNAKSWAVVYPHQPFVSLEPPSPQLACQKLGKDQHLKLVSTHENEGVSAQNLVHGGNNTMPGWWNTTHINTPKKLDVWLHSLFNSTLRSVSTLEIKFCMCRGLSFSTKFSPEIHGCRITEQGDQILVHIAITTSNGYSIVLFSVLNSTLIRVHQHLKSISTNEDKVVCSNYNWRHETWWHQSPDSNMAWTSK